MLRKWCAADTADMRWSLAQQVGANMRRVHAFDIGAMSCSTRDLQSHLAESA
jgi:hypothetical protein